MAVRKLRRRNKFFDFFDIRREERGKSVPENSVGVYGFRIE